MSNEKSSSAVNGTAFNLPDEDFDTRAIHVGQSPDQWDSRIVIPPIHTGSTFKQDGPGESQGFEYGRSGNPSRSILEKSIASLDKVKYALTFSSGVATVAMVSALLKAGDHVVCAHDVYGATYEFFHDIASQQGIESDFVDASEVENVVKAIKPNTKLVWIESPSNPILNVIDVPRLAAAIRSKSKYILYVIDNTFMTPYLQKPHSMGVDIAVYSLTKYMNGHSDVIMGAITTDNEELYKRLAYLQSAMGVIPSPFDCYLVNRSLKTLSLRMDRHIQNATKIARFLEQHPLVEKVIYPGLESHPQYETAKRLWYGPSGMIAMYIKGDIRNSTAFLKALKFFTLAVSLGNVQSLVVLPSIMSHTPMPEALKKKLGLTDNLIRISVGLESATDLIQDLDQALKVAATAS